MSTTHLHAALLLIAGAATAAGAVAASNQGPNQSQEKASSAESVAVETLLLADNLAVYGIRNADPVAIAQAAKMKKSIPQRALDATKQAEGEGAAEAGKKNGGYDLSPDALLARAQSMAGDNSVVQRLIAEATAARSRGAAGGVKYTRERVLPGRRDVYTLKYVGGQAAAVAVIGDGDTDLDLYVYDENGNMICRDTDYTDRLACEWTPRWTGNFRVVIENLGRVYNEYQIATN